MGVCLGHQGIVHVYGGEVINAHVVRHGKTSKIKYLDKELFGKLSNPFVATRYHSLVASRENFPTCLEVTAISLDDSEIMGLKHKKYPIYGVQFHPELKSTVLNPHPLFVKFVAAAMEHKKKVIS